MNFGIPIPKSPFVDKTGLVNREWYLFLNSLFTTIGNGVVGGVNQVLHGGGAGYTQVDLTTTVSGALPITNFAQGLNGQIIVGATGLPSAYKTMSGDAVMVSSGAITITANAVSNSKLAQMATVTLKGNNTGGTANPLDLTVSQAVTMLSIAPQTIGSWTPTDNSGAGLIFANVSANFTRIGNMVFAYATLDFPVTIDGSAASITGLPVVAANTGYAEVPAIVATNAALSVVLVPVKATQTANFDISTTLVGVTNVQLSGSTVKFGLAYPVA